MSIAEKLQTIAENEQRVYDAGYAKGQAEGGDTTAAYDEGFEAGKKAEYDAFWDEYQQNGNRTNYIFGFAGICWNVSTLKPKYDLKIARADYMFASTVGLVGVDLTNHFEKCGIAFDTSNCTNFNTFLRYESPLRIPTLDTRKTDNLNSTFVNCSVKIVDKIILRNDGSQILTNIFAYSNAYLEEVIFEGVIGCNLSMNVSEVLSKASITSIINALSTTTSGLTVTLYKTAVDNAFTAEEWAALIATRTDWTISLV